MKDMISRIIDQATMEFRKRAQTDTLVWNQTNANQKLNSRNTMNLMFLQHPWDLKDSRMKNSLPDRDKLDLNLG